MKAALGWYKNQWLDIDKILISANNRGLKFGDGIFETILIRKNKPILFDEHLERLENSSKILNINLTLNKFTLKKLINEGIKKLALENDHYGSVRINYSRGANKDRALKINSILETKDLDNLWLEFFRIKPQFSPLSVLISEIEKRNEFSLISKCKTFSYNQAIQVLEEANKKSFDDSILLNTSGELCCGSTFNLLIKRNNEWITPRKESGCLEGIMVAKALKLKIIKEEFILPKFQDNDIIVAINSLSCRQINQVNDLKLRSKFNPIYFWDLLYN
ncbi:aminotransferase class IV [uncultured Prochlorococcus sp.]|uniref:aminotransferase class IV n=1 Tax=uncultured Prochlorococcus sp. TaxID=159733 RepID=UPI002583D5A0|nr:aminotransferase class IV [uncultured Prochlorococcus sp.]